jgi:hypothetical protein
MSLRRGAGLAQTSRLDFAVLCRVVAISILGGGVALAILGAALVLNLVSLRELVESTRLDPAIAAVFEVRDELSHRRAQTAELGVALGGGTLVVTAGWWLRAQAVGRLGG